MKQSKINHINNRDRDFKVFFLNKRIKTFSLLYLFGIILSPLYIFLDYAVAREHFGSLAPTRFSITAASIPLYIIYKKYPKKIPKLDFFASLPLFLLAIHIALVIYFTGGATSPYALGSIMMIVIIGLFVYCYKLEGFILTIGLSALYTLVTLIAPGELHSTYFFTYTSILLTLAIFIYYSLEARYKLEQENFINQKKIEEKNNQLLKLDQAKTRFFTNLTHEFRTPLVSLSTLLQMIGDKISLDPKLSSFLKSSSASLNELLENINDLLSKTKADQGFLKIYWAPLNIQELISNTVEIFKPIAAKKNLELNFKNLIPDSEQPQNSSPNFYADRFKLKKILNNLISNAIKYTQQGKIEVTLKQHNQKVVVAIKDTGIGIPTDELDSVFEPFTQASNNEMKDVKGTGLGLSIVKDFVSAHQGNVFVESQLNQGTQFTIELPLGKDHIDPKELELTQISDENIDDLFDPSNLTKMQDFKLTELTEHKKNQSNILLVDDNPQVLQSLGFILKEDYNLHFAQDGKEGFAVAQEIKPDLIISDIMMPKKNGYQLLQDIKADYTLQNIPVILLTAKVDLESKVKGLGEGADDYISKPFNIMEVKARIKNLLDRKKLEREFLQNQEKMASLGKLVSGITHEILNPVAYAKSAAENIPLFLQALSAGKMTSEKVEAQLAIALNNVQDGIHRVSEIVQALRLLSHQRTHTYDKHDIHEALEAAIKIFEVNHKSSQQKSSLKIHQDYQLKEKVFCNPSQLSQVFLNLLINAAQATQEQADRQIWIATFQENEFAKITIRDNGPGIPHDLQQKIFHPFFSTKAPGEGSGLGLYISQQIVQEHQGKLEITKSMKGNTEFSLLIPINKNGEVYESTPLQYGKKRGVA